MIAPLLLAILFSGADRPLAVRAGRIHTGTGATIEKGVLIVGRGRVLAIGKDVAIPEDADVLDAGDAVLIPGLVAADSALAEGGRDAPESISAHFRAIDGFDPYARRDPLLAAGITTAYVSPGRGRLLSGRGAVVKLAGAADARTLREEADLRAAAGEASKNPPPIFEPPIPPTADEPILPARPQLPGARLGTFLALREAIAEAKKYREARSRGGEGRPGFDAAHEGLLEALDADLPLRIACVNALDIEGALDFVEETRHRAILDGGAESWKFAERLRAAGVPVVLDLAARPGGRPFEPGLSRDAPRWRVDAAARLAAAGVLIALAPPTDAELADLPLLVGLAIRGGLERDLALRSVTSQAAAILGVDDRVGSLEVGKDADFVVLSGEPFAPTTHALEVYVGGERVFALTRPSAVVVRAGTVFSASGPAIRNGAVLVEKGKIAAVGSTVPHPPGARVIDAGPEGFVTPGLVDANSRLGLEEDRTSPSAGVPVALAASPGKKGFPEAAAAGVTTILMGPYATSSGGAQVAAIKTGAKTREAQFLRETAAIRFDWRGGDRAARPGAMRDLLKSAKDYAEKWDKYFEEVKKAAETKPAPKEEKPPAAEQEAKKPDPISGTWEGTITIPPIPHPTRFVLKMRLSGTEVSGSASAPAFRPEEIPFSSGRFEAGKLAITFTTPFGSARLEATVDREDHLTGAIEIPGLGSVPFEANRTAKEESAVAARPKRKKGPEEPALNEDLEPFRKLLKKEIVALVDAARADEIESALAVFAEFGLSVTLLGGEDGWRVAATLAAQKIGVVVPPGFVLRVDREDVNLPDRLARAGVPVAFGTEGEAGTKDLPLAPLAAVARGMDPTEALRAVTIYPARLFKLDDRVGSLEPGRDGDLVVWSGDPLDPDSRVLAVIADGEVLEREP